jgi:flagellar hook-length control protein FliK
MSAKTVFTESPACPAAPAANSATAPATPGEAATDFQNLLAGAVPPIEPSLIDTLPTQAGVPMLLIKNPATNTKAPAPGAVPLTADVSPSDLLKLLDDAATLLPEAGEDGAEVKVEVPEELIEADDTPATDDDLLAEWLDMMVPASVFAAQAGSGSAGDAMQGQGGGAEGKGGHNAVPASLTRQALVPEQLNPIDVAPQGAASATSGIPLKADMLAVTQNQAAAFATALTGKSETTEKEKPSADGWMTALGDLSAKRGQDAAPLVAPKLSTPVHDARWADALAHRLVMMARDGESSASLKLVPQDLGPLDIQINVRDGEATVHFGAAHQETRNVLEASLPRLRELLGAQGLQLSNATVSHQQSGQNRPERSSGPSAVGAVTEEPESASAKSVSTSLLDIYA